MRRWICVTLFSVFFVVSPLLSSDAIKAAVTWRFRNAVGGRLLEAGRLGVVDWPRAEVWHKSLQLDRRGGCLRGEPVGPRRVEKIGAEEPKRLAMGDRTLSRGTSEPKRRREPKACLTFAYATDPSTLGRWSSSSGAILANQRTPSGARQRRLMNYPSCAKKVIAFF